MPKPAKGEQKNDYISRCIRDVRHEGTGQEQAVGKCYGMWKYYKKKKRSKKESRFYDFETFVNEAKKERDIKKEIDKEIRKMKREQQKESGADLRTRVVPSKKREYKRDKKVNPEKED
jgi:hypothetical protein